MKDYYRTPQIEDGLQNIILQNRCGNRLTLLVHESHTELEFLYRPNARRNKDLAARNFSNRDLNTALFGSFKWPDISAAAELSFCYDPFYTRLETKHASGARNVIHLLNLAKENAFVLAARAPLLMAFRPHREYSVRDGLITEAFRDRGRDIISFVGFPGFAQNRFRVLDDGTHVLQLIENDPVLIGAEENEAQVERLLARFSGRRLDELVAENEATLARDLSAGHARLGDPRCQEVFDLNRRIGWSAMDAGGACFGAANRVYQLLWVRDASMSAVHHALAGNPEFIRLWAPFLWANPSRSRKDDGRIIEEFGQMVGTPWSKSEDDGLFYATWTLFVHFRTTGDDRLLRSGAFDLLVRLVDAHLDKCWDAEAALMISDTLGEESLRGSPYFGYDIVNGALQEAVGNVRSNGRAIARAASFYHQVNTVNVLRMGLCLFDAVENRDAAPSRWRECLSALERGLREQFIAGEGEPYCVKVIFEDGTTHWATFEEEPDPWEYAWALAQGPFAPLPDAQVKGALRLLEAWPRRARRSYGLCPWNVLNRFLHEQGALNADTSAENLRDEVEEALMTPRKYPMRGALHEDHRRPDTWRGLPFTIGSFTVAQTARLLSPLPQGLAVREGGPTRALTQFRYRLAAIDVSVRGTGRWIRGWTLNGEPVTGTLQIPEMVLRPGRNEIVVELGDPSPDERARLYRSDAELLEVAVSPGSITYHVRSALPMTLEFERDPGTVKLTSTGGGADEFVRETRVSAGRVLIRTKAAGDYRCVCSPG